ncbi:MAG: MGMT family protein [Candidatus Marinimicrobia bacterium]|nr:MGMT family protein [Candidatus Neomarinimicrobiota bacterium]
MPPTVVTPYAARVYAVVRTIPAGRVASYAWVAARAGGSPRAVGQALRRNPFAPEVPCHRVIAAQGAPGGFQGRAEGAALARKLRLLATEGVCFHRGRLVNPAVLLKAE